MADRRQRLVKRRKALGFTQERLAARLGVDPTTVRRWESGETQTGPQPWLRPKLARYLQVSVEHLDELFAEATDADTGFDARLDYSLRHPSSVDLVSVARLREQVDDLDKRYDRAPSTLLLAEAGQRLGQLAFLSAHASVNCVRRELWAVEAAGATLMGQLVWDASQRRDHATAHAYFDRAIGAARQRHDLAAEGLALLRKSFVALYGEKDPQRGLQLTMQTAETTKTTSYVLTGLGLLHTAEAHAMLGHLSDCERALSEADAYFSRIEATDAALDLFSPTQLGRLAGSCYLLLDKVQLAQRVLESTALELRERSKSRAIVLGNLSLAYIRLGELEEAAAVLHQAIDVIELTWGGGGMNIAFSACRKLQSWRRTAVVHDVLDRAMALMAAT